jgi:hypothetical protein
MLQRQSLRAAPKAKTMDLDLDALVDQAVAYGGAVRRGRPRNGATALPSVTFERPISLEDLADVRPTSKHSSAQPLQRLRATHHACARYVAEGRKHTEVAALTGYSPTRISIFLQDPSFQALVAHYKEEIEGKWLNVHERFATLAVSMVEEVQHRLEEQPESLSTAELNDWVKTLADRSGFGPSKTSNVNIKSASVALSLVEQIKRESTDSGNVRLLAAE